MTPATKSKRAAAAWQTCDGHLNICISRAFTLDFPSTLSHFDLPAKKPKTKLQAQRLLMKEELKLQFIRLIKTDIILPLEA